MKKLLMAVFAALLFASPVFAGQNLRQLDTGGAEWVRGTVEGVGEVTYPIGSVYLTMILNDIVSATTYAVVSPITDARVSFIQMTTHGLITTTNNTFSIWRQPNVTSDVINLNDEVTDGAARMFFNVGTAGSSSPTSITGNTITFTPNDVTSAYLERGSVILIHTNGSGAVGLSGTGEVTLTITVVPRGN